MQYLYLYKLVVSFRVDKKTNRDPTPQILKANFTSIRNKHVVKQFGSYSEKMAGKEYVEAVDSHEWLAPP